MTVSPDFFLPDVWSLDTANVQAIESSATDPKVRLDSTGVFVTDGSGGKQVLLDQNGLKILIRPQTAKNVRPAPNPTQEIEIVRNSDLGRIGRLWATEYDPPGAHDERFVHVTATDEPNSNFSEIQLSTQHDSTLGDSGEVRAIVNTPGHGFKSLLLLDELGNSDFTAKPSFAWHKLGQANVIMGPVGVTIEPLPVDAGSTSFLLQTWTPPVDSWLLLLLKVGYVQAFTAAYNYCYFYTRLTPSDQDGLDYSYSIITQHSLVNLYEAHTVTELHRLQAGVAYTFRAGMNPQAGSSFGYYGGPQYLSMGAIGWPQ